MKGEGGHVASPSFPPDSACICKWGQLARKPPCPLLPLVGLKDPAGGGREGAMQPHVQPRRARKGDISMPPCPQDPLLGKIMDKGLLTT